jgi:hypothetical protein
LRDVAGGGGGSRSSRAPRRSSSGGGGGAQQQRRLSGTSIAHAPSSTATTTTTTTGRAKSPEAVKRRAEVQKRYRQKRGVALSLLEAERQRQLSCVEELQAANTALAAKARTLEQLVAARCVLCWCLGCIASAWAILKLCVPVLILVVVQHEHVMCCTAHVCVRVPWAAQGQMSVVHCHRMVQYLTTTMCYACLPACSTEMSSCWCWHV